MEIYKTTESYDSYDRLIVLSKKDIFRNTTLPCFNGAACFDLNTARWKLTNVWWFIYLGAETPALKEN